MKINVYPDKEALTEAAATIILERMDAILEHGTSGSMSIALAGGNTPKSVYSYLAASGFTNWSRVHLFWGDERTVPPDHVESNYRMVRQALLDHVAIPESNIHRIYGEYKPADAAQAYEKTLRSHFEQQIPAFDLVLLGMGDDGHTASLFPATSALDKEKEFVSAVHVPKLQTWRITLTYPVLNNAKTVIFMVAGSSKARKIGLILRDGLKTKAYPASLVKPEHGELIWLLDADAARSLDTVNN